MLQHILWSNKIKEKAKELGFEACGISKVRELTEEKERLNNWLQKGLQGSMSYMERNVEKRLDPNNLVKEVKSVVSVLLNYFTNKKQNNRDAPKISKYAYGEDYHYIMKEKLWKLHSFISNLTGKEIAGRAFVDSAPVLEKTWAVKAGLGFIGKNTMLINKKLGSFVFVGELLLDVELQTEEKIINEACGKCTRCIDACPTEAIVENRVIDARKCISYLTIEHKGDIPTSMKKQFKNWVMGCDICQDVCPWNSKAKPHSVKEFQPKKKLLEMNKKDWYSINQEQYNTLFKNTAVERVKYKGLIKNLDFLK